MEAEGHRVDEEPFLWEQTFGDDAPLEAMNPVVVDTGLTRRFIQDPATLHVQLVDQICREFDQVARGNDHVIIEGSGHTGASSNSPRSTWSRSATSSKDAGSTGMCAARRNVG